LDQNGNKVWSAEEQFLSPAIDRNGNIFGGSFYGGGFSALDSKGNHLWDGSCGSIEGSPVIANDGTIYIGSRNNYLYALNPDGSRKWRYKTRGRIAASPVIGDDGTLYVTTQDARRDVLYAISAEGKLLWKHKFVSLEETTYGSPVMDQNGILYVMVTDINLQENNNKVFAFHTGSSGPANSPWPMFQQNAGHTGLAEVYSDKVVAMPWIPLLLLDD
jgi:outer membrane protein assembly factor BamB